MTPIDVGPARQAPAADGAQAGRGTQTKAKVAEEHRGRAGFPSILKKLARDAGGGSATAQGASDPAETALARWHRLEAHKAAATGGAKLAETDGKHDHGSREGLPDEAADGGQNGLDVTGQAAVGGALAAMAARNRQPTHAQESQAPLADQADNVLASQAGGSSSEADHSVSGKILAARLETHFAPVSGSTAGLQFAQRLAHTSEVDLQPDPATRTAAATAPLGATAKSTDMDALPVTGRRGREAASHGAEHRFQRNTGDATQGTNTQTKSDMELGKVGPSGASDSAPKSDAAAPGAAGSPMQQLGGRLLALAEEMSAAEAATPSDPTGSVDKPASMAPVRVLSINLQPAELGAVTVRMTLVGEALNVQIEADSVETARLLQSDRDSLSQMLSSAGVQVEGVTVRVAHADPVPSSAGGTQPFLDQGGQAQSGGTRPDQGSSGAPGDNRPQSFAMGSRDGNDSDDRRTRRPGGGLYV